MTNALRIVAAALCVVGLATPAAAQKPGGILKVWLIDSPAREVGDNMADTLALKA